MTPPNEIEIACIAGARGTQGAVAAWYAGTARSAIEQLKEKVRTLELNLASVEAHLARSAKADQQSLEPEPKRLVGKEREG